MNVRERFNRAMKFQSVDRLPVLYWGAWNDTRLRWQKEGMVNYEAEFARYDGPMQNCWLYNPYQGPFPQFEEKILADGNDFYDIRNQLGQIERRFKETTSMPAFLEYPVKNRNDWNEYKKRLNPDDENRYPANWPELVRKRKTTEADEIRGVAVWGFYGFPREMLGTENLSLLFYDDPDLVFEMNEYWLDFSIKRLARGLKDMDFDYALIWEDNCCKHGMLHSPQVFERYMKPFYKKLVDFFRSNNVGIISVDSDGNVEELIPLLLNVGVTAIHPFEVAAGMDVVSIGKKYPDLQIWGGIDKRVLAKGKNAIDDELQQVIPLMKKRGGYAAGLDHAIPSDVPLENHRYYIKQLLELAVY